MKALRGGMERSLFHCHKVGFPSKPVPFSATSYSLFRPLINRRKCNSLTRFLKLPAFPYRAFAVSSFVGHRKILLLLPRPDCWLLCLRALPAAASTNTLNSRCPVISFRSLGSHRHQMSDSADKHPDKLAEVIELIERDETDMESKLTQRNLNISFLLVTKILHSLNGRGISALRFFHWVQKNPSSFTPNSEIYNLIIDNCGRLEDYDSMLLLLGKFSSIRHCLTEKAFGFLATYLSDRQRAMNSVKRVVQILNQVKGSCRSSGIYYLIKVLCALNHFDLAIFVMEETARKTSYYNILMAAKCKRGYFDEARELFDEMKSFGCDPTVKSYNCLLGSLCKNGRVVEACELLEKMEKLGFSPDAVTFEIIAVHACRLGRLDFGLELLYHMISEGVKPRLTTHAAFVKGLFFSGRPKDAYMYVADMREKDKCSVNSNYSLLVKLLNISGRVVHAQELLVEMMKKGIKPHFPVYVRVLKELYRLGMRDRSADLKCRFLRLSLSSKELSV
ncbi:hypothetical protein H6P81_004239 [Aristolochia fimbriata]|uniref:Pentatricopeptide repeat-containing protein n=1 Tax=Aristolochia fimbriata TaxID=158543 RepID=A0AAV7FHE9_ARIFI|nr:hypothetical protein H6P81_004239 [Aristolochia fimbriata]